MKLIQETQKQTKLLQFLTLCRKYCQMMKSQKGINSLNSKQREVYNVVQTWAKDNVQYDGHLLGPTGISAVNIGRPTIHSGLGITPGTKLLDLNDKSKVALRDRLSEVKL